MAMLVREKLTGVMPPASAGKVLDLWRPFNEGKAGGDLGNLRAAIEDQQAFARVVRHMLSSMQMAEALGEEDSDPEDMENPDDDEQPRSTEMDNEEVQEGGGYDRAPSEPVEEGKQED